MLSWRPVSIDAPIRILLVDDDARVLRSLERLLRAHFRVETAASGEEAIERVGRETFDCVVSDFRMGAADGLAVLEATARAQPACARILLTGDPPEEIPDGLIEALLLKPWQNESLIDAIRRLSRVRPPPGGG